MNGPGRLGGTPTDPVVESRAFGPSFGYLVIALLVVAGAIAYWATSPDEPGRVAVGTPSQTAWPGLTRDATPTAVRPAAAAATSSSAVTRAPSAPAQPESRMRDPNGDLTPDLRDYLNAGENPSLGEVINRLHQAGVYTGIGAFNPPNTRPNLVGLAVPEDFVLPDGYVRHYQTTDDGQPIDPILMYAPDRQIFDAAGRPIAVPKDRVVPPEQAPPGLPIRRIAIPAPVAPDKPGN